MAEPSAIKSILDAWAARHGVAFEWRPDKTVAYTDSRGAWFLSTRAINGRDDWISVHPSDAGLELEKIADAGHVEALRLAVEDLAAELDGILEWFQSWTDFFSFGPGQGH